MKYPHSMPMITVLNYKKIYIYNIITVKKFHGLAEYTHKHTKNVYKHLCNMKLQCICKIGRGSIILFLVIRHLSGLRTDHDHDQILHSVWMQ